MSLPYTLNPGSTYGFLIFDVSNASSPLLLIDTLIYAPPVYPEMIAIMGCELKDSLLYFGRGDYGFDIWKIKTPDSICRLITQETPILATHCYPSGNSNIHVKDNIIFILDDGSLEMYKVMYPRTKE